MTITNVLLPRQQIFPQRPLLDLNELLYSVGYHVQ